MNFRLLLLAAVAGLCTQCARTPEPAPTPTYDERIVALMSTLAPQIPGTWTLTTVHVQRKPYLAYPDKFPADTLLRQFATLRLQPAAPRGTAAPDPRYPEFEGELTYKQKAYPVRFRLMESGAYIQRQEGPPATLLLEFSYPAAAPRPTEPEEDFLRDIGLINENFSLAVSGQQHTMTWQGLSRSIERIEMQR